MNYISQKGQDQWAIETVFKHQPNGYFVDLAASDGKHINNTYVLEKQYGWTGICIEPNPNFFQSLIKNRNCIKVQACVDSKEHEILFRFNNGVAGGIVDDDTDNNMKIRKTQIQKALASGGAMKMKTKTFAQILKENHAPRVIDFLSMDVEGSETRIFSTFPFHEFTFLAMCIERPTPELNQLLFQNGYVFVKNSQCDTFYIHESISNFNDIPKEHFEQIPRKNW